MARAQRRTTDQIFFSGISYGALFIFGMICVIPFVLIIMASVTSEQSLVRNGYQLFPAEFSLESYRWVFRNPMQIVIAYRNTIAYTVFGTTASVLMTTMTGYVLSRKDFAWRNGFSFFFFFTTLFHGGLVPWYILCIRYLGFKNSYYALILPLVFSIWHMIIAKNFMRSIPYEIIESVKVDGANDVLIYFKIILPLAKPLLATLGLFSALAYWNDWYNSMLFISDPNKQTLQYFLYVMLSNVQALKQMAAAGDSEILNNLDLPSQTMKMAMTCVATGPVIFLYPLIQRHFIKGLTIGAVKG
jgi:putative aldouronate transport system permease protein